MLHTLVNNYERVLSNLLSTCQVRKKSVCCLFKFNDGGVCMWPIPSKPCAYKQPSISIYVHYST